jgi:K+-sensing histidine kinase KdpD
MSASPDPSSSSAALQHAVRTHLTTIRGQAQLVARRVRQLPEPERTRLLTRLAAIDGAVEQIVQHLARWSGTDRPD